ncbi:hypothetical protein HDF22_005683 [Mucilaginibacter lappiensis]|uniref:Uncharacterized protein n=1 Tax=Mucilaginibacter lappiensis TaxID=354630 RepID=A0A841JMP1_9SPHI|nr:hypothetical protein [Mucilaginibacter lappiensis]
MHLIIKYDDQNATSKGHQQRALTKTTTKTQPFFEPAPEFVVF